MTYHNTAPKWDCKNCENLRQRYSDTSPIKQVRCKRGHMVAIGVNEDPVEYPIPTKILSGPVSD